MDSGTNSEPLTMAALNDSQGSCDRGNCTGDATNSYKRDQLCNDHFQQFMAMQYG